MPKKVTERKPTHGGRVQVSIYLDPEDHRRIEKWAKKAGLSPGPYMRMVVLGVVDIEEQKAASKRIWDVE